MLLLTARLALAHDHAQVSASGESLEPSVGFRGAAFAYSGYRTGSYFTVSPALTMANAAGVWGSFAVPIHHLTFVGSSETGPGDVMAGVGCSALRRGAWSLEPALWTMWPTGDSHASLGSAHVMLSPELGLGLKLGRWSGRFVLATRVAIPAGEHGLHEHQPLVAPHDLVDVKATMQAGVMLFERLELGGHLDPVIVAVPHPVQPVGTRVSAGVAAGLTLGVFRLGVSASVPLTANRTYDWAIDASVSARLAERL